MGATSDDLMDIARAGAERIDMPDNRVRYPSFSDIEEQCASEYDELLDALHDDELFAPADVQRQEEIVQRLKEIVGEGAARVQIEEHRRTAEKRLPVPLELCRIELSERGEQLALTAGPLQQRPGVCVLPSVLCPQP